MASFTLSLRGLASRLLSRPPTTTSLTTSLPAASRPLSTTAPYSQQPKGAANIFVRGSGGAGSKGGKRGGKGKGREEVRDPKVVNMLKYLATLSPPRLPPPLRFARNRYLRHWTIHRAWLLFRRREREAREATLMRQHQSMHAACEELRLTEGPGTRDQGYLYRVAMEKKGVYGLKGIPIEYARAQTETPARTPWNHDWKR